MSNHNINPPQCIRQSHNTADFSNDSPAKIWNGKGKQTDDEAKNDSSHTEHHSTLISQSIGHSSSYHLEIDDETLLSLNSVADAVDAIENAKEA